MSNFKSYTKGILHSTVFFLSTISIISAAYIIGCYKQGNVLHIVQVPRENAVFVSDSKTVDAYEAFYTAQNKR